MDWDKDRYDEICEILRPFLSQTGFNPAKAEFVPVGALLGVNLVERKGEDATNLAAWYKGPTLVDLLGAILFSSFVGILYISVTIANRQVTTTCATARRALTIPHIKRIQRTRCGHRRLWKTVYRRRPGWRATSYFTRR